MKRKLVVSIGKITAILALIVINGVHGMHTSGAYFTSNTKASDSLFTTADWSPPDVTLFVSKSWTKELREQIANGKFADQLESWETAGKVEVLESDEYASSAGNMVKLGHIQDYGNYAWENKMMQSFPAEAKSLSIKYNLFTRDSPPFDDKGFLVKLNGKELYRLGAGDAKEEFDDEVKTTGWKRVVLDLSKYTERVNLEIYAGNTGDTSNQTWVYVDEITTNMITAPADASYELASTDKGVGTSSCFYRIDSKLEEDFSEINVKNEKNRYEILNDLLTSEGEHSLDFYCVDKEGNQSKTKQTTVWVDDTKPSTVNDLEVKDIGENYIGLNWTAPGNNESADRASKYEMRYLKGCSDVDSFVWNEARIYELFSPNRPGEEEYGEILGLNPEESYCFALKTADQAPNWSDVSNVVKETTLSSDTPISGDVVINEMMWMGSNVRWRDEWIELRNMTDRTIDLEGWYLERDIYNSPKTMYSFPAEARIDPYGYVLVSDYDKNNSSITVTPDYVVGSGDTDDVDFVLSNSELVIELHDDGGNIIDIAWDGTEPRQGVNDNPKFYSLQRVDNPRDGANPFNWYTCIDELSKNNYFGGVEDLRGTPGGKNR